jgi:hypothetical protein
LKYNDDGSLTLYAGATSPGKDKESNWLPAPNGTFSRYMRAYWADKARTAKKVFGRTHRIAIIDGTWTPPAIEKVK